MKKEYIMTDEDKELKRIKIEQNRNKRKLKTGAEKASSGEDQDPEQLQSKKSIKVKEEWSPGSATSPMSNVMETQSESSTNMDSDDFQVPVRLKTISCDSTVQEILDAITQESKDSSQVIQNIMKTQAEALQVMSKIIQEPSQALILISHLIKNPSDGMIIISKMMQSSPLDALSVFTQFMSSPTDALQIIFKIMSSPKDVLRFMTELTKSPQDALEIMNRFLAAPADALAGINRIILKDANSMDAQSPDDGGGSHNDMIKTMLEVSSIDSPNSSVASPSSAFQSIRVPDSPQDVQLGEYDTNNNDYHHNTAKLLNEINQDIKGYDRKQSQFNGNSIDSIINEAIKLEYETPPIISQMQSSSRELTEVEIMKIQELLDSNNALYAPVDEDLGSLLLEDCHIKSEPGVDPMLLKVINLTAIAIRRLIKMSKKIAGFKKMCQEDQIALLKVSSLQCAKVVARCARFTMHRFISPLRAVAQK